jgi:3-oxoacyl-[acyl-carrier protein] reductase
MPMPEPRPRALVTGASRGIGAACARALGAAGFPVIVHCRSERERAEAVAVEIRTAGGRAEVCQFDVREAEATRAAIDGLLATGPIGVVVVNAGIHADAAFPAMRREDWDRVIETTLDGFFNVTQPLVMPMVSARWGRIVVISSVAAILGSRGQVNYAAAKAGLIGAARSLAREVARRGVTVNAVAPGLIDTDMLEGVAVERLLPQIPMERLGRPEEVAAVVAFLAGDSAAYVTGQVVGVNGGMVG